MNTLLIPRAESVHLCTCIIIMHKHCYYNSSKGAKFLIFCPANAPLLLHAYSADFKFLFSKLVESNENILAIRL